MKEKRRIDLIFCATHFLFSYLLGQGRVIKKQEALRKTTEEIGRRPRQGYQEAGSVEKDHGRNWTQATKESPIGSPEKDHGRNAKDQLDACSVRM